MAFLAYCHTDLHLSFSTIKLYLAGVQHYLTLDFPSSQSLFSSQAIKSTLRGIQKSSSKPESRRKPVTGAMFRAFSTSLDNDPFGPYKSIVIKAAMYLCFYGFLRPGEFTSSPGHAGPTSDQLVWQQTHCTLSLPSTKTSQVGPPVKIIYFPTFNDWCPVAVFSKLLAISTVSAPGSPLFPFNSKGLSTSQFIHHIRTLASGLGFDAKAISGHSFRIGAASAASSHGVPAHVIQKMGRWQSSCFTHYIPNPRAEIAKAFTNLAL
ncbi:uncharacterized protein LOC122936008 [Bufo gargarizans]|uniref:uncharacterized protein LOC122936008 n=1 Tax=Bufo gargarizans TaxID=30331 RepID=UPI001CF39C79|nr:uncharacterized protein LOC122936008 [Bufo gargarizans]